MGKGEKIMGKSDDKRGDDRSLGVVVGGVGVGGGYGVVLGGIGLGRKSGYGGGGSGYWGVDCVDENRWWGLGKGLKVLKLKRKLGCESVNFMDLREDGLEVVERVEVLLEC